MTVERYLMEALKSSPVYVEDVFSTYLYTGNGSTQTITNNIDLSTKGGMVWIKSRSTTWDNIVYDTARGSNNFISTNTDFANGNSNSFSFLTNGFGIIAADNYINQNAQTYASWTFRKQPKFFDVVTWTGNGVSPRNILHGLGSIPGFIIVKNTSVAFNWYCYHSSLGATKAIILNQTGAPITSANWWNNTSPTASQFTVNFNFNSTGETYVAYLFADQAGGFGLSGSDSVVACGSATTDASLGEATVNLGWEPQFLILKNSQTAGYDWVMADNMRGIATLASSNMATLLANTSGAETTASYVQLTATGFKIKGGFGASQNVIYLAIRRGPMKVPTSGTSVFSPITTTGAAGTALTTNFSVDMQWQNRLTGSADSTSTMTRLIGVSTVNNDTVNSPFLKTSATAAETSTLVTRYWNNTGYVIPFSFRSDDAVYYNFARAPGFMDVVCYTGTGSTNIVSHNLGVAPECVIIKNRISTTANWVACLAGKACQLNTTSPEAGVNVSSYFTASTISVGTGGLSSNVGTAPVNTNGSTYVAYLFATCPGVSKVGSYTGTGAAQNINCGFSAGARFVLIKRTDSTGDWYTYDSARGISSGNDPYLLLNSTAAQVTGTNYVDTFASGFTLTASAPAALNANGGSYIFLAVA